jgi:uncharacterized metal-binding protein
MTKKDAKKAAKKTILSKSGGPARAPTCTDCFVLDCYRRDKKAPNFCLTDGAGAAQVASTKRIYAGKGSDGKVARAAAEIEGRYYGKLTRVEEIVAFARRIEARRIGIATCIGLVEEARLFTRVLAAKGFEWHSVLCKVGSVDKTDIGIPDALKIQPGHHEAACNPILQAKLLNAQKTDLNVIIGLCVGHDALFTKHSRALVTTLITKDRVLGHNPAAALYTSGFYYKRIFDDKEL